MRPFRPIIIESARVLLHCLLASFVIPYLPPSHSVCTVKPQVGLQKDPPLVTEGPAWSEMIMHARHE